MSDAAYDRDWRGRADRAEAEVTRLRAALARLLECPVSDQAAWDNALEVLRSTSPQSPLKE